MMSIRVPVAIALSRAGLSAFATPCCARPAAAVAAHRILSQPTTPTRALSTRVTKAEKTDLQDAADMMLDRAMIACSEGDWEMIKQYKPALMSLRDREGNTLVMRAARHGDYLNVRKLLQLGFPPNGKNKSRESSFHMAFKSKNSWCIIRELLSCDCNEFDSRNAKGETPLQVAVSQDDEYSLRELLERDKRSIIPFDDKIKPLLKESIRSKSVRCFALLLKKSNVQSELIGISKEARHLFEEGDKERAIALLEQARTKFRDRPSLEMIGVLNNLGQLVSHSGDKNRELTLYREAKSMGEKLFPYLERGEMADTHINLGNYYSSQGDDIKARFYWGKRPPVDGDVSLEMLTTEVVVNLVRKLEIHWSIGGSFDEWYSVQDFERALMMRAQLHYEEFEDEEGLELLNRCCLLGKEEASPDKVNLLSNQATLWAQKKDWQIALNLYEQALEIAKEIYGEEPNIDLIKLHCNIALAHRENGDEDQALSFFEQGDSLLKKGGDEMRSLRYWRGLDPLPNPQIRFHTTLPFWTQLGYKQYPDKLDRWDFEHYERKTIDEIRRLRNHE